VINTTDSLVRRRVNRRRLRCDLLTIATSAVSDDNNDNNNDDDNNDNHRTSTCFDVKSDERVVFLGGHLSKY